MKRLKVKFEQAQNKIYLMQDITLCDNKTQHYKQKLYYIHNRC